MPTLLLNKSVEQVLSLPYPYAGCVPPGESAILREDPATVVALLGVSKFARMPISLVTLRASEVRETDYAPYDPVVRLTSSDTGYVLKPWQRIVSADTSGGAILVYGPSAADLVGYAPGHYEILVLDATSSFATHAFTLNGNGYLINGAATLVLSTVNQAAMVGWRGGSYIILSAAAGAGGVAPHAATHRAGGSDPLLAAPGAIGGTTPSTGAFTTLAGTILTASTSLRLPTAAILAGIAGVLQVVSGNNKNLSMVDAAGDVLTLAQLADTGTASITKRFGAISLADDASLDITSLGLGGHGTITAVSATGSTGGSFSYAANGATSLSGLTFTSFDAADTDTKLCVFASGGALRVRNRLGTTQTILIELCQLGAV